MGVLHKKTTERDEREKLTAEEQAEREKRKREQVVEKKLANEIIDSQYREKSEPKKKNKIRLRAPKLPWKQLVYLLVSVGAVGALAALSLVVGDLLVNLKNSRVMEQEWLPRGKEPEVVVEEASESSQPAMVTITDEVEAYRLVVADASASAATGERELGEFVVEALGLDVKTSDEYEFELLYGTDEYSSTNFDYSAKWERNYWVLVSDGLVEPGVVEYEGVVLELAAAEEALEPALSSVKYCQVDADCAIRGNFCTYGAFNRYQPYVEGWSCVGAPVSEEDEEFGVYDQSRQCRTQLEFTRAECRENQCVGVDKRIVCAE